MKAFVLFFGLIFITSLVWAEKVGPLIAPNPNQNNKTFCIQVITPALNLNTGECKYFPTPCDVPNGWIIGCENQSLIIYAKQKLDNIETRQEIINKIKTDKKFAREILNDNEIRSDVLYIINKTKDIDLLKSVFEDKVIKKLVVKDLIESPCIRNLILNNSNLSKEILPEGIKHKVKLVKNISIENSGNETLFRAKIIEQAKLFGFIPINIEKEILWDENETIIEEKAPWWSIFTI